MNLGSALQGTPGPWLPPCRKCLLVVGHGSRFGCVPMLAETPAADGQCPSQLPGLQPLRPAFVPRDPGSQPQLPPTLRVPAARSPVPRPHQSSFSLRFSWYPGVSAASCSCCFMIIPRASIFSVTQPPALSVAFSSNSPVRSVSRRCRVRPAGPSVFVLTPAPCLKGGSSPFHVFLSPSHQSGFWPLIAAVVTGGLLL